MRLYTHLEDLCIPWKITRVVSNKKFNNSDNKWDVYRKSGYEIFLARIAALFLRPKPHPPTIPKQCVIQTGKQTGKQQPQHAGIGGGIGGKTGAQHTWKFIHLRNQNTGA